MADTDREAPQSRYRLARRLEDSGHCAEAEEVLLNAAAARPGDPTAYLQLAGFYRRNGQFDRTMRAVRRRAELEPDNPEAYYTIAMYYWEEAFRSATLDGDREAECVRLGIAETDKALELNPDYVEALTCKSILLRMRANLTGDVREREDLLARADELHDRAEKLQRAGAGQEPAP